MSLAYVDLNKCGARLYYKDGVGLRLTCEHGHTGMNDIGGTRSFVFCPQCLSTEEERAKQASLVAEKKDQAPVAAAPAPVSGDAASARRINLIENIYRLKNTRDIDAATCRFTGSPPVESSRALDELIQRLERELEFLYASSSDRECVVPNPRV